jgi:hypothetical protein
MKKSLYIIPVLILGFIFTNAYMVDWKIDNAKMDSAQLYKKIHSGKFSDKAIPFLKSIKTTATNYISIHSESRDCEELLENDEYLITGNYLFKNNDEYQTLYCEVKNGRIVNEELIETDEKPTVIGQSSKVIVRDIVCSHPLGGFMSCTAHGVMKPPAIISEMGDKECKLGENYGFNENGIWVNEGCGAKFEVSHIVTPGMENLLKHIPNYYERLEEKLSVKSEREYQRLPIIDQENDEIERLMKVIASKNKEYRNIRSQSSNPDVIAERESSVEKEAKEIIQKYIHLTKVRTCSELFKNKDAKISGVYYFYSGADYTLHRHVNPVPQFCDASTLIMELSKFDKRTADFSGYYNKYAGEYLFKLDKRTSYYIGVASAPTVIGKEYRTIDKKVSRDDSITIKGHSKSAIPSYCVARKDVQLSKQGPYNFVGADSFGDIVYKYKGKHYCLKQGVTFIPHKKFLTHAYYYKYVTNSTSNWSTKFITPKKEFAKKIKTKVISDKKVYSEKYIASILNKKQCNYNGEILEHGQSIELYNSKLLYLPKKCKARKFKCNDGRIKIARGYKYLQCVEKKKAVKKRKKRYNRPVYRRTGDDR